MNFIDHTKIESWLQQLDKEFGSSMDSIEQKIESRQSLSTEDILYLISLTDSSSLQRLFSLAKKQKETIYGTRIVMFAPLYLSNHCVNNCVYCGYRRENEIPRRRLTMDEIVAEVKILEKMGHKRLALEVGEDPRNCPIEYVIEAIETIYKTAGREGDIRRVNVNIAATGVEEYRKLKEAGIGTYILFQETYHRPTYERVHPKSLKGDYEYHLNAFTRAMEAGVDDVGAGVLFGLYDWRFELLALLEHNRWLEERFGVGFHTVSVPRIKPAEGVLLDQFTERIDDDIFRRIVAILRLALPLSGIILSTRESAELRKELISLGVSQISAGSSTGVGGYKADEAAKNTEQFSVEDHRTPLSVLKELIAEGYLPSYCTACYRKGRTGDRFMSLARSGNIRNVCQPNALMTLVEYAATYGDSDLIQRVKELIPDEIDRILNPQMREYTIRAIEKIWKGERDFFV
ncbi:[FeFe] hydrogenase H-cluster radical SAM maturase HydG [Porphyromonadaceae bacterium]